MTMKSVCEYRKELKGKKKRELIEEGKKYDLKGLQKKKLNEILETLVGEYENKLKSREEISKLVTLLSRIEKEDNKENNESPKEVKKEIERNDKQPIEPSIEVNSGENKDMEDESGNKNKEENKSENEQVIEGSEEERSLNSQENVNDDTFNTGNNIKDSHEVGDEQEKREVVQLPIEETSEENVGGVVENEIHMIDLDLLDISPLNYFRPISSKKRLEIKDSIRDNGILTPLIVRPQDGRYEVIAGQNRKNLTNELVIEEGRIDLRELPCQFARVDDLKAKEIVGDTNMAQRDDKDKSPMAIAIAYETKAKALERKQGKRTDLEGEAKGKTRDMVGESYEVSGMTVGRYLRLLNMIPELQELLDAGDIKVKTCFEIGLLDKDTQTSLINQFDIKDKEQVRKHITTKNIKKVKEAMRNKDRGLKKEEIVNILEGREPQPLKITLTIPADYDIEIREFVEVNIVQDPNYFLELVTEAIKREMHVEEQKYNVNNNAVIEKVVW